MLEMAYRGVMSFNRLLLLISATLVFILGLVMIFSTTSAEVLEHDLDRSSHQAVYKQLLYACMGYGVAYAAFRAGYDRIIRYSPQLLGLFTFFLLLVLIPGIGKEVNGSKRWLGVAGFSFQPSEFVKYLVPAYFILRVSEYQGKIMTLEQFGKLAAIIAVPMLLIMVEPNNGTAAVIGMTVLILCLLMQVPVKFWAMPLAACVVVAGVFAYNLPYVTARINVYLHPELDLKGKGHQPYQAKIAAGSGQLWGKGPGNSLQKLSYLPEAQNDYIAAIFGEEFGFFGVGTLIVLYMTLTYLGFKIASQAKNKQIFYYASAITFLISFQSFLNLGVVSGLLPSTGLNLPLFSQGGTSLIANMMGIGLLLKADQ